MFVEFEDCLAFFETSGEEPSSLVFSFEASGVARSCLGGLLEG